MCSKWNKLLFVVIAESTIFYCFSYKTSDVHSKRSDFTLGVCCILQGHANVLQDEKKKRLFECSEVSQTHASFVYSMNDKVISRFVHLKYTGQEDIFVSS